MLIDKPRCNFKNCRYCFDGNCISADKYENCKLTDLHSEIAKLTVDLDNAKTEWISVDERLPDNGETVLTVDNEGYMIVASWYELGGWFLPVCRANPVTHWMPLPEPPKGE